MVPGEPDADWHWLTKAIELSRRCPPSPSAFSVGAIVVAESGQVIATGYSRQTNPYDHAEEVALGGAAALAADLGRATLYSSLEPCLRRVSRPIPCAQLVWARGIRRIVIAWREPPVFQPGGGVQWLAAHGTEIVELGELAAEARAVNQAVLGL